MFFIKKIFPEIILNKVETGNPREGLNSEDIIRKTILPLGLSKYEEKTDLYQQKHF